jgi:hypothetical protein
VYRVITSTGVADDVDAIALSIDAPLSSSAELTRAGDDAVKWPVDIRGALGAVSIALINRACASLHECCVVTCRV